MRSPTAASTVAWPSRIFRPWVVASAAGSFIGAVLLQLADDSPTEFPHSYIEVAPRAAVQDPRGETSLSIDPFAPASSLAAPPDAPAPTSVPAVTVQTDTPDAPEPDAP